MTQIGWNCVEFPVESATLECAERSTISEL